MAQGCIKCGARVRNANQETDTCSPECTRAKHNGRTREEQIRAELDEIPWGEDRPHPRRDGEERAVRFPTDRAQDPRFS